MPSTLMHKEEWLIGGAFGQRWFWKDRWWYRYDGPRPRPVQNHSFRESIRIVGDLSVDSYSFDPTYTGSPVREQVENRALDVFTSRLGEAAALGVDFAERRQSIDMIVKRTTQLIGFTRSLRKGDFRTAGRYLGVDHTPKRVRPGKQLANNWLEYHFGWEPLIKDIHQAVEVLQGGVPPARVKGKAARSKTVESHTSGIGSGTIWYWTHQVCCGAEVSVSNPNLWLANQMGLINPAVVAWELVPFSFVVDWFVPVGNFLSSFTTTAGLNVQRQFTTHKVTVIDLFHTDGIDGSHTSGGSRTLRRSFAMNRISSLPSYHLILPKSLGLPSVSRAATAVSLLLQQMKGR